MLVKKVTFTAVELNAAIDQAKTVVDTTLLKQLTNKEYRPVVVETVNNTGADITVNLFTNLEWTKYQADNSISAGVIISNTSPRVFNDLSDEVTTIVVKGTTGHASNLEFIVYQE